MRDEERRRVGVTGRGKIARQQEERERKTRRVVCKGFHWMLCFSKRHLLISGGDMTDSSENRKRVPDPHTNTTCFDRENLFSLPASVCMFVFDMWTAILSSSLRSHTSSKFLDVPNRWWGNRFLMVTAGSETEKKEVEKRRVELWETGILVWTEPSSFSVLEQKRTEKNEKRQWDYEISGETFLRFSLPENKSRDEKRRRRTRRETDHERRQRTSHAFNIRFFQWSVIPLLVSLCM